MAGFSGHGVQIWVQHGTGAAIRIGELMDVTGPSLETTETDVTSNDSVNHTKEFIVSLISAGELSFPMLFDVDRYNQVKRYATSQNVLKMMVLLPTEPNILITCGGYISSLGADTQMEEAIKNELSFMVTGVVRFLEPLTGELTLTPKTGTDDSGSSGTDRSGQRGYFVGGTDFADDTDFGTLTGDDGDDVDVSDIVQLYSTATTLNLRIDDYDGPVVLGEFYMLLDREMRRIGQTGASQTSDVNDFIYTWGGSIGTAPFTVDQAVDVQLFAAV